MHVSDEKGRVGGWSGGSNTGVLKVYWSYSSLQSDLSQPTDPCGESPGCSRKEESFAISLGKAGENEKREEKRKETWPRK